MKFLCPVLGQYQKFPSRLLKASGKIDRKRSSAILLNTILYINSVRSHVKKELIMNIVYTSVPITTTVLKKLKMAEIQVDTPLVANDLDISCVSCGDKVEELQCLPCLHSVSVCEKGECREKLIEDRVSCSQCKEVFAFPVDGFPCHSFAKRRAFSKVREEEGTFCCADHDPPQLAVSFCSNCPGPLCEECQNAHRSVAILKKHQLTSLDEALRRGLIDKEETPICPTHKEPMKYFCQDCEDVICIACQAVGPHKAHQMLFVDKRIEDRTKEPLLVSIKSAEERLEKMAALIQAADDQLIKLQEQGDRSRQDIDALKDYVIEAITSRCDRLVAEIEEVEQKTTSELEEHKSTLQNQINKLEQFKTSTEEIVSDGTTREQLFITKMVAHRVSTLTSTPIPPPPPSSSSIHFVAEKKADVEKVLTTIGQVSLGAHPPENTAVGQDPWEFGLRTAYPDDQLTPTGDYLEPTGGDFKTTDDSPTSTSDHLKPTTDPLKPTSDHLKSPGDHPTPTGDRPTPTGDHSDIRCVFEGKARVRAVFPPTPSGIPLFEEAEDKDDTYENNFLPVSFDQSKVVVTANNDHIKDNQVEVDQSEHGMELNNDHIKDNQLELDQSEHGMELNNDHIKDNQLEVDQSEHSVEVNNDHIKDSPVDVDQSEHVLTMNDDPLRVNPLDVDQPEPAVTVNDDHIDVGPVKVDQPETLVTVSNGHIKNSPRKVDIRYPNSILQEIRDPEKKRRFRALSFTRNGLLLATDELNKEVCIFNDQGRLLRSFEVQDTESYLDGIAELRNGNIAVSIYDRKAIAVYTMNGEFVGEFGSETLDGPSGLAVAVDHKRQLFAADYRGHKISVYSEDGEFHFSFGSYGSQPGEFKSPEQISIAGNGLVYVVDCENDRVQVFQQDGQFVWQFVNDILENSSGLALTRDGNIVVASPNTNKLSILSPSGRHMNIHQVEDVGLKSPYGVAIDDDGFIFVADCGNCRIVKL